MNTRLLSYLVVNLSIIRKNYRNLKNLVGPKTAVSSVVKSDAYGMGLEEISKALFNEGCREFYVDDSFEGEKLRKILGRDPEIFLFKGLYSGDEEIIDSYNLTPVLNNEIQIELLESFARKARKKMPCCLHVDTGMTRLGVSNDNVGEIITQIEKNGLLEIKYIISHLSCADNYKSEMNQGQLKKFQSLAKNHPKYKYSFANSAGIFLSRDMHFDQVRPGISLYGGVVGLVSENVIGQAVSVTTKIINIYKTKDSVLVGYGATYKTKQDQCIATIPIGYFNGIFRCLSNKGFCYINGNKAPYIGNISMGLMSIDLSSIPEGDRNIGQEVEIIGKNISLETIAKLADTINYEILTSLKNISHKKYI